MEAGGLIANMSWTVFDLPLHSDESEMMAQPLSTLPIHGEEGGQQELPWFDQSSNPCYYNCNTSSTAYSNSNASSFAAPSEYERYCLSDSNEALDICSSIAPLDLSMVQVHGATEFLNVIRNHSLDSLGNGKPSREDLNSASGTNKRKHLAEEEFDGQTRAEPKRVKKAKQTVEKDASVTNPNGSCSISDNDSSSSQEAADAGATSKGKSRAGRGAATDPQSLHARKRRERINERLKTLQTLVPNGTKVDINTILEEAVHYVKFLQLQIKLLNSNEMWMYAPIAYNGMNIGLDLNIDR